MSAAIADVTPPVCKTLSELVPLLASTPGFSELVAAVQRGEAGTIDGAWGSSSALAAAALAQQATRPLLVVLSRPSEVDDFADDLSGFLGHPVEIFPAWETLPSEVSTGDFVFGKRLRIVRELQWFESTRSQALPGNASSGGSASGTEAKGRKKKKGLEAEPLDLAIPGGAWDREPALVIVTTIAALLQPVPSRSVIAAGTRTLKVGEVVGEDEFQQWLLGRGFERVTGLQFPGEFAVRGGIVDVYPIDSEDPIRIEFFGDEIESIRKFDVESQRTIENLKSVEITVLDAKSCSTDAPSEAASGKGSKNERTGSNKASVGKNTSTESATECLIDCLPAGAWIVLGEIQDLKTEGKHYLDRLRDPRGFYSPDSVLAKCYQIPTIVIAPLVAHSMDLAVHLKVESVERFNCPRAEVLNELAQVVGRNERVLIACHNEGEQTRLSEMFQENAPELGARVMLCVGRVARGFRLAHVGIVVISDNELFNRTEVRRVERKRKWESRAIDSFLELHEGDYVVHVTHGIAVYHGMQTMLANDQREEHLVLEFRNEVKLYVPVSLIHLVQKYVGGANNVPELSTVGTVAWAKKKERVEEAVADLAVDMLQLQASRDAAPGIACRPDSQWMTEFDAAFPYTETPDQTKAIADCKADLERQRPMDRLICGDVGYGKTEVAMRAAFKAIDSGRQVAVLVPTTVLAEQHFRSFSERMAEFPITIESLSRFKTKKEQKDVVKGLGEGSVDLVIGTHRLVSKDVKFKDLGLVIIDEEQRFGVDVKEALKKLRLEVDVLTLSATPIPRTLHMSLLGIRDISNLTTPPQDRVAVSTHVVRWDGDLIRQAIVRELNRNGQVFFVHNRIYNIFDIKARLQSIVPEARFDVGHGQMSPDELESAMLRFVRGETDVFIATTIIESGVDIPNANTIFIHQAENYGLADLHQLRGRVGRYKHRAYCYLLMEEGKQLTDQAAKRLKAIEEFSELGAGFRIAMRDLEIRGAGNILGTEQSGHIMSVGYELYCQLLENAVKTLKKEPVREFHHVNIAIPHTAYFPSSYVPPGRPKIEIYRRLSTLASIEELRDFETELRDRFGPVPTEAQSMLDVQELQILGRMWHVQQIHVEDHWVVLTYRARQYMLLLQKRYPSQLRIVDDKKAYLMLKEPPQDMGKLILFLKKVLQPFSP